MNSSHNSTVSESSSPQGSSDRVLQADPFASSETLRVEPSSHSQNIPLHTEFQFELHKKRKFDGVEDESGVSTPQKRRKEDTTSFETSPTPLHFLLPSLPLALPPPSPQPTESVQDVPLLDINLNEDPSTPPLTIQQNEQLLTSVIQNSTNQNQKGDNINNTNVNTIQNRTRTRRARRKRSKATQSIQIQITRKSPKLNEGDYEEGELIPDLNETEASLSLSLTTQSKTDSNDNTVNTTVTLSQVFRKRRRKRRDVEYFYDENPNDLDYDWYKEYNRYNLDNTQSYDHDYYDYKDYDSLPVEKHLSLHNGKLPHDSNSSQTNQNVRSKSKSEMESQGDVGSKLKSRRYCTCEGHLADDKEKRSIYTHQFPGETFIPKCVLTRNQYNQKPTINNELFAYKLTATPSIVRANYKRTTIIDRENNNKEFSFNGFIILTHSPINMPPLQITHMGTSHILKLEPFDINEIIDYLDFEIMEWFYEYLWLGIMEFSDFLRPTYKDEGERHIHGCTRFHIFPQFICKTKKTNYVENSQSIESNVNQIVTENLSQATFKSQTQSTTTTTTSSSSSPPPPPQQQQQQDSGVSVASCDKPKSSPRRPRKEFTIEYFSLVKLKRYLECVPKNVYEVLRFYLDSYGETKGKVKASRWLETQIVMTTYSRRAFRVDEIEWHATPEFSFTTCDQKKMTYKEYMEKVHNQRVTIPNQPLLFHKRVNFTKYVPLFRETERKGHFQLSRLSYQIERRPTFLRLLPEFVNITGIRADVCQWALVVPAVLYHARLIASLMEFEKKIDVQFNDHQLLKQAIIHPSYWEMLDSVAEEIRDASSRLGSWFVSEREKQKAQKNNDTVQWQLLKRQTFAFMDYDIHELFTQNQRLEFLGDALLEFITSSHLFLLLPDLREGELSHIRTGLVNNKVLCHFAELIGMQKYVLYPYHDELLQDVKSRSSVVADCYESLLGAIYLDRGMLVARLFLANSMFVDDPDREKLVSVWLQPQPDPLLTGPSDRHLINRSPTLARLTRLEENTGIYFSHIRLLAAAFTHPSVGNSSASNVILDLLQTGSNQRLEFLGDSVLQFLVSRYIYNRFPEFLEGQLTLVRTTLVNNEVLAQVAVELGLNQFIRYFPSEALLQDGRAHAGMLADTFEAYLAAMYLDRSLGCVEAFLGFVLFPRIDLAIKEKLWIDSKTKLAKTIFNVTKTRNFIPYYKVLSEAGPPHMRTFTVACYVGGYKLSEGKGISIHAAEQDAAKNTLLQYDFTKPLPERSSTRNSTAE